MPAVTGGANTSIFADPTLELTKRGRVWTERASAQGVRVHHSKALSDALRREDWETLDAYLHPWFRRARHFATIDVGRTCVFRTRRIVPEDTDVVAAHLAGARGSARIALDVWCAIRSGDVVAARRPPTLDIFVAAGATLLVKGPEDYWAWIDRISQETPPDLSVALARRARFLIARSSVQDPRRVLVVDQGPGRY